MGLLADSMLGSPPKGGRRVELPPAGVVQGGPTAHSPARTVIIAPVGASMVSAASEFDERAPQALPALCIHPSSGLRMALTPVIRDRREGTI